MHHSRVMAGAMTLLLLSAPASWAATPQKAKAVPTAEPFEGVVIAEGLSAPSARGAALPVWIPKQARKSSSAAFRT